MTIVAAVVSMRTEKLVWNDTAMMGEISLRGVVLPVGGIKEKAIATHRMGMRQICIPAKNKKDVDFDVPQVVKDDVTFVYAEWIKDMLWAVFEQPMQELASL